MGNITYFQGPDRRRQLHLFTKQLIAQGVDSKKVFEETCNYNEEYNDPPLPDSDIKHTISVIGNMLNFGRTSVKAESQQQADGLATRTVTLHGHKITYRGTEIIGVE